MNRHNDKSIKEVLQEMIKAYRLKPKLYRLKIEEIWKRSMGASISGYTRKITIRKRKVYITIASAALKQELAYGREKIKDMLNEELGEAYVEEVIIR